MKPCRRSCNFLFGRDVTSCLERHHLPAAGTRKRTHASNTKKLGHQLPSCGTRPPEVTPACETFTHASVKASPRTPGSLQVSITSGHSAFDAAQFTYCKNVTNKTWLHAVTMTTRSQLLSAVFDFALFLSITTNYINELSSPSRVQK